MFAQLRLTWRTTVDPKPEETEEPTEVTLDIHDVFIGVGSEFETEQE